MPDLTRNILDFYKPNETNNEYLTKLFSNHDVLGFFTPNIKKPFFTEWNGKFSFGTVDEHTTYNINRLGYRGEFYEDYDVLASGCSITFGIGVPEEARWTNSLGRMIDKDIMNLGNPGASVEIICSNIIQHCMNNKMPKEIFCLFPDFFRSMVVVDKEFYKSKMSRGDIGTKETLDYTNCGRNVESELGYVFMQTEDKSCIEDSISPHQLILNSVNSIYMLESFCLKNNIRLHWTTWDLSSSLVIEELINLKDFKLKNFTKLLPTDEKDNPISYVSKKCNLDHANNFKDSPWWNTGSDYSVINSKKDTSRSHPGIHFQQHVAELFYNLYKKDN